MTAESFVYKFNDLHRVPQRPGLYAWHALPSAHCKFRDYHGIFKEKAFRSVIRGNLLEEFTGTLNCTTQSFSDGDDCDRDLLRLMATMASPPLYIGMAANLRDRLDVHSRSLCEHIHAPSPDDDRWLKSGLNVDQDSVEESRYFAARIGQYVRGTTVTVTCFFVKIIVLQENYSRKRLQFVERLLNLTYNPIYGRR